MGTMKSFAFALLGAIAAASTEKSLAAADVNYGTDTPPLTAAIPIADETLKTGSADAKATLKQATGVRKTSGSDAQTYFQYMFEIVPTALYKPTDGKTKLSIAFAADDITAEVDWTQWSVRALSASSSLINYNYATIARSIKDIEASANSLNPTELATLAGQVFAYTIIDGKLKYTGQEKNDKFWDPVTADSSYATGGAQTMVMERKNAGVE